MTAKLEIQLQAESYQAGDTVRGSVRVVEAGNSRSLSAFLRYQEKTDYTGSVSKTAPVQIHEGPLVAGQSIEFDLELPNDAPPAIATEFGSMWWEVVVRSDRAGLDRAWTQRVEVAVPAVSPAGR